MSRPRYAPITSSLLVRKGEAKPWDMAAPDTFDYVPPAPHEFPETQRSAQIADEESFAAEFEKWLRESEGEPPPANPRTKSQDSHGEDHAKRCTIRLNHTEFERLGLIAVKREITRQQALRQAVDRYLAEAKREYQAQCDCLAGRCSGDC